MKTSTLLNLTLAIALVVVCGMTALGGNNKPSSETATIKDEENAPDGDFKPFDVTKEFKDNAFDFFCAPLLLMAGDSTSSNAMTIGWGSAGNIWGHDRPTITVYVAQKRYTHEFMERSKYFTVMKISDEVLDYMGSHSGRNGDKGEALGLHVAYTDNGAPYYTEATEVYECEIMYEQTFSEEGFRNDIPKDMYADFPAGIHTMYMGEVTGAWRK